jgi:hypothetical protein
VKFEGRPDDPTNVPSVQSCWISPDFFRTLDAVVVTGRAFNARDDQNRPPVVIVNKAFADFYWPSQDPLGQRIATDYIGAGRDPAALRPSARWSAWWLTSGRGLDSSIEPAVYLPYARDRTRHVFAAMTLFVKRGGCALAGGRRPRSMRFAPTSRSSRCDDGRIVAQTLAPRRFVLAMFGSFAGLALVLAAVGIFGMMAHRSQRIRELRPHCARRAAEDIIRLVLTEGAVLSGCGIVLGALASIVLTRLLSGLLFGVTPTDPLTFGAAAAAPRRVGCRVRSRVAGASPIRSKRFAPSKSLRILAPAPTGQRGVFMTTTTRIGHRLDLIDVLQQRAAAPTRLAYVSDRRRASRQSPHVRRLDASAPPLPHGCTRSAGRAIASSSRIRRDSVHRRLFDASSRTDSVPAPLHPGRGERHSERARRCAAHRR